MLEQTELINNLTGSCMWYVHVLMCACTAQLFDQIKKRMVTAQSLPPSGKVCCTFFLFVCELAHMRLCVSHFNHADSTKVMAQKQLIRRSN